MRRSVGYGWVVPVPSLLLFSQKSSSPYINRFLQPDTIIPAMDNPQSWNRFSYVKNNPLRYTDPTGHKTDDGCGGHHCPDNIPPFTMPSGCTASWPWMCDQEPQEPEDPEEKLDEISGTSGGTSDPWCGPVMDWCVGDILSYRQDTDPIDARVVSLNLVSGFSPWHLFAYSGIDVVWTSHGLVVFKGTAVDTNWPASPDDVYTPQTGISLTYSEITSDIIRERPGAEGIIEAWSGHAMQEGFSILVLTVNSSSSVDSNGNPNFQTTSTGAGLSFGFPDTILEYHRYLTNAEPIPYFIFNR
jgi:hypothetical protein